MIILRYHGDFLRLTASAAMPGHLGAVSLKKSHDSIVILSFSNIVKGQANRKHAYYPKMLCTTRYISIALKCQSMP